MAKWNRNVLPTRYAKDEGMIEMMRTLKDVFDPNGIMNPYKLLPWK